MVYEAPTTQRRKGQQSTELGAAAQYKDEMRTNMSSRDGSSSSSTQASMVLAVICAVLFVLSLLKVEVKRETDLQSRALNSELAMAQQRIKREMVREDQLERAHRRDVKLHRHDVQELDEIQEQMTDLEKMMKKKKMGTGAGRSRHPGAFRTPEQRAHDAIIDLADKEFNKMDRDRDGRVSFDEVKHTIKKDFFSHSARSRNEHYVVPNKHLPAEDHSGEVFLAARQFYDEIDSNKDGSLGLDEFVAHYVADLENQQQEDAKSLDPDEPMPESQFVEPQVSA